MKLLLPVTLATWLSFAGCASTSPSIARGELQPGAGSEGPAKSSQNPQFRDFETLGRDNTWFGDMLNRLDAVPVVLEYRPGVGFAANSDAKSLIALDNWGRPFHLRRRNVNSAQPSSTLKDNDFPLPIFEPVDADDDAISESTKMGIDSLSRTYLAFNSSSPVRLGPLRPITIPSKIVHRDRPTDVTDPPNESYGYVSPSGQYSIVFYAAYDAQDRERWLRVILYDTSWNKRGATGRTPSAWGASAHPYLKQLDVEGIFEVMGFDHPVFITRAVCSGFVLHTFLTNGHLSRFVIENDTRASSNCTI
jgi:hypothetical protein